MKSSGVRHIFGATGLGALRAGVAASVWLADFKLGFLKAILYLSNPIIRG
jgi:hypothetical protein